MNWKAIFRWASVSLILMLVLMFVAGIFVGIFQHVQGEESNVFETAILIMLIIVINFIEVYAILFGAALLWALAAWQYPVIEIGDHHRILLAIYGICIGVISGFVIPSHISVWLIEGTIFALSICIPRFFLKKLKPGTFTIIKKAEELIAIEE